MDEVRFGFAFEKARSTGRYVRGFATVVESNGEEVNDHEGDYISIEEIEEAAHDFIGKSRDAKVMHEGEKVGEIVESVIIDHEFAKALGMSDTRRGWWIGMKVLSEDVAKRVRSGELKAFSIGGRGLRTKVA